jgi:hypothetical protein
VNYPNCGFAALRPWRLPVFWQTGLGAINLLEIVLFNLAKARICERESHRIWHTTSTSAGFPSFTTFTASRSVLIRSFGSVIGPAPQQP